MHIVLLQQVNTEQLATCCRYFVPFVLPARQIHWVDTRLLATCYTTTLTVTTIACSKVLLDLTWHANWKFMQNENPYKLKICAHWNFMQIETLCKLKVHVNLKFMQIESSCKSKIHANLKFLQIVNWTGLEKLKWWYFEKWKSKVGACRLKMRSPFKGSGRGQCQGSRLKTIPGCKTECAFLLLLLLGLTSAIKNGQRRSKLIKLDLHFGVMSVMLKHFDTFQNIGKADGRNPFLNIPSRRLPRTRWFVQQAKPRRWPPFVMIKDSHTSLHFWR